MISLFLYVFGGVMEKQVVDKLKYLINKKKTLKEITEALDLEPYEVYGLAVVLKESGLPYDIVNGEVVKVKYPELLSSDVKRINSDNKEEFCFVSDLHYASVYDRPDLVQKIYEECKRREISTIFCCGDITDGYYPDREDGDRVVKFTDAIKQAEYVANTHPYDPNIKFYMIGGNHDDTHMVNEGIDIGQKINQLRPDMIYLGMDEADIQINKLKIKMFHGKSKRKTLLSSNAEKYLEHIPDNSKPHILQLGHIHQSFFMRDGCTNVFQTGSLLDQTPFLTRCKIRSERSCWFAKIDYDSEGYITSIIPELKDYGRSLSRKK